MIYNLDYDDCAPAPCLNGGTCTDEVNGYTCTCATDDAGADCQTGVVDLIFVMDLIFISYQSPPNSY